jgi:hypothetical protein
VREDRSGENKALRACARQANWNVGGKGNVYKSKDFTGQTPML